MATSRLSDAGYLAPFDTSTELGQKQEAAQALHNSLIAAREAIMQVAPEKIQAHVQRLLEFEAMGHWANYVAAHMTSITNCTVHSVGWQDESWARPG